MWAARRRKKNPQTARGGHWSKPTIDAKTFKEENAPPHKRMVSRRSSSCWCKRRVLARAPERLGKSACSPFSYTRRGASQKPHEHNPGSNVKRNSPHCESDLGRLSSYIRSGGSCLWAARRIKKNFQTARGGPWSKATIDAKIFEEVDAPPHRRRMVSIRSFSSWCKTGVMARAFERLAKSARSFSNQYKQGGQLKNTKRTTRVQM